MVLMIYLTYLRPVLSQSLPDFAPPGLIHPSPSASCLSLAANTSVLWIISPFLLVQLISHCERETCQLYIIGLQKIASLFEARINLCTY